MRTINFTKTAFSEYNSWRNENKKIQDRIADLIEDILRHPFEGIGKPEALKHHLKVFGAEELTMNIALFIRLQKRQLMLFLAKIIIQHYNGKS